MNVCKNPQPKVWQSFIGRTRMDQHNFVPAERIDNGKGHWQEEQETAIQIQILGWSLTDILFFKTF